MSHNINTIKKEKGLIKYIFYIFIIILILSYFGFNLKEFMLSDSVQNNLGFIWDWIIKLWKDYLKPIYDFLSSWFGPYISNTLDGLKSGNYDISGNIPNNLIPNIK